MRLGCSRQNINQSSEKLIVIYINYQFETSELKNVEKLVEQRVQALKFC